MTTMRVWLAATLLCLPLAACATGQAPPSPVGAVGADAITLDDHLQGQASMLQRISVVACATGWDQPRPTVADAQPLLKRKAAAVGATGILRARYEPAGLFDGCGLVPALKATGIAYRLAR